MTPAPRKHILVRSGALAAAVAASVSGGAYAAVEATGDEALPLPSLTGGDLAQAAEAPTAEPDSTPAIGNDVPEAETATANAENVVVEDVTEAHGSTEEETDQLPKGEKKVKTAGVDGLTRTISRVTTDADGNELSREVVSTVAVTAKVDEVVLVGTKEEAAQAASKDSAGSGDSGSAAAASAPQAVSGTDAASAQATARSMMGAYGWGDSEFSCLVGYRLGHQPGHPDQVGPGLHPGPLRQPLLRVVPLREHRLVLIPPLPSRPSPPRPGDQHGETGRVSTGGAIGLSRAGLWFRGSPLPAATPLGRDRLNSAGRASSGSVTTTSHPEERIP